MPYAVGSLSWLRAIARRPSAEAPNVAAMVSVASLAALLLGTVEVATRHGGSLGEGLVLVALVALGLACLLGGLALPWATRPWFPPALLLGVPLFYARGIHAALVRIGEWSRIAGLASVWLAALALGTGLGFVGARWLARRMRSRLVAYSLAGAVGLVVASALVVTQVGRGGRWLPVVAYAGVAAASVALARGWYPRPLLAVVGLSGAGVTLVVPSRYEELASVAGWAWVAGCVLFVGTLGSACPASSRLRAPHLVGAAVVSFAAAHLVATRAPDSWANARGRGLLTGLVTMASRLSDVDRDGHGFLFSSGDCAPLDSEIHAGMHEQHANGVDDNCLAGDYSGDGAAWVRQRIARNLPPSPWKGDLLLVVVDALRHDAALDPSNENIRALASRGVDFQRAYSASTFTGFAMAGLLEARIAPHADLIFKSRLQAFPRTPPGGLIPWLVSIGYDTGFVGGYGGIVDVEELRKNYPHGSRVIEGLADRATPAEVVAASRKVWAQLDAARPRFLYVHVFWVHRPELTRSQYQVAVGEVDRAIGDLVDLAGREAMVVLTADHGEEFGEHGGYHHASTLYEEVVHVPLIVAHPGLAHRRVEQVSPHLALLPTLMAMLDPTQETRKGPYLCLGQRDCNDLPAPLALELSDRHLHGLVLDQEKAIRNLNTDRVEVYDLSSDSAELQPLPSAGSPAAAELTAWEEAWFGHEAAKDVWRVR